MVKAAFDMSKFTDEQRIEFIGKTIMKAPKGSGDKPLLVGVIVDNAAKAARYVALMKAQFPEVRHIDTQPAGIDETQTIRFGEPLR